MKEKRKRIEERMIDIKVSSCSETERRNRMLLKAAFINGLRCNTYNNKEYEGRYCG